VGKKTKTKMGSKAAKTAAKHPGASWASVKAAVKVGKPVAKKQARQRIKGIGTTARTTGALVAMYGPLAVQALGLVEVPKRKRTLPRVAVGVVIGAGAMYFFGPQRGS
jgi:hypothetical protein